MAQQPVSIGQKLEVQWPSDSEFYQCTVADFSIVTRKTKVVYHRNSNAVEEFLLDDRVWKIAPKSRGRPLQDPIVGKHIELDNDVKLSRVFDCTTPKLRCFVLKKTGPSRYDLLLLVSDRIAYGRNLSDVFYQIVDPNEGRDDQLDTELVDAIDNHTIQEPDIEQPKVCHPNDELIVESLSDEAEPPSSSSSHSSEDHSLNLQAQNQDLMVPSHISPVSNRDDDVNLQMPLFVSTPALITDSPTMFPTQNEQHPNPLITESIYQAGDFNVEAQTDPNQFNEPIVLDDTLGDFQNNDGPPKIDATITLNAPVAATYPANHADKPQGPIGLDVNDVTLRREQAARDAVHRFVSVARQPNEPRSLGYVLGYENKEQAHKIAWIDSVDVSSALVNQDHEILKTPPKISKKRQCEERPALVHSKKRPRTEMTGKWISIENNPALVVGSRPEKHLVFFADDERVEEVVLSETAWAEGGKQLSQLEHGGLVGKRIVVLDKIEDGKEKLFEAFVVGRVGAAKYRLLYTFTGMLLVEDLRNRDKHWDIVSLDSFEFRGRNIVTWSRTNR